VAVRGKVDLTVSGLKSDSPRRIGIAGSAPAGVRAQERAICRNSPTRPHQANTRPSTACRMTSVRTTRIGLQTGRFLDAADDRRAASPESVRPDAEEQGDCRNENDLQIHTFPKAAEGIRTLDLLHGKQNLQFRFAAQSPWKHEVIELPGADGDSTAFHGKPRGFRHRRGSRTA
jgi:hypothetical protein